MSFCCENPLFISDYFTLNINISQLLSDDEAPSPKRNMLIHPFLVGGGRINPVNWSQGLPKLSDPLYYDPLISKISFGDYYKASDDQKMVLNPTHANLLCIYYTRLGLAEFILRGMH